jgi:tRNA-2-methylthio-N6-dimethylallyladenosine synthase
MGDLKIQQTHRLRKMSKSFFIETFGCQMNKSDSELMRFSLLHSGFTPSRDEEEADILVFNTCSVREHAENRAIARIRSAKTSIKRRDGIIILTGCMAQRIGNQLVGNKTVDLVIGPFQSPRIGEIIDKYLKDRGKKIYISQDRGDFENRINLELAYCRDVLPWHKWVTITHGCDNLCSYCIVPHVRGPLISFSSDLIREYTRILSDTGITEITLLGQNVNQYGMDNDDIPFYKLLMYVSETDNLMRINFLTSHPKDFADDIIEVIKDHRNISRSIHLPLQSGSNRILALMNRNYTIEHYLRIIEKIDHLLDDYSISTDIIVGFPGETEEDFYQTLRAVENIRFDDAFMYAYSPREGTSAFNLRESLTGEEKIGRLQTLIELQRGISREKLISRINHNEEIIVERISKKSANSVMGKTFLNHPVIIPGEIDDIGEKIKIRILGLRGTTLLGSRIA